MCQISEEKVKSLRLAYSQISEIKGALLGLGALFEQQNHEIPYENEELHGISQILKLLGRQASEAEDRFKESLDI